MERIKKWMRDRNNVVLLKRLIRRLRKQLKHSWRERRDALRRLELEENRSRALQCEIEKRDHEIKLQQLDIDRLTGIVTRDRQRVACETAVAVANQYPQRGGRQLPPPTESIRMPG